MRVVINEYRELSPAQTAQNMIEIYHNDGRQKKQDLGLIIVTNHSKEKSFLLCGSKNAKEIFSEIRQDYLKAFKS